MAIQKAIDNDSVTLTYHSETGIVHHEFHKYVHGPAFRDALTQGLDLLKKNHATKWLSDDRGNSALSPEDTQWAQTVWFPAVKAAGWTHWAVVLPEKVVGQLNMKAWVDRYKSQGINSQVFNDPAKALAWLAAQ